jgi:hypothetical protein
MPGSPKDCIALSLDEAKAAGRGSFLPMTGSSTGVSGVTPDDPVLPWEKFEAVEVEDLEVSWRRKLGCVVAERLGCVLLRKIESAVLIGGKPASSGNIRGSG